MYAFRTVFRLICLLLSIARLSAADTPQNGLPDDSLSDGAPQRIAGVSGGAVDGSLEKVVNAFLRAYAADRLEWRVPKDLKLGITPDSTLPEGWQMAQHPRFGWYAFRPKTCDMLTVEERRALIRDPRFPSFIAQMRLVADGRNPPLAKEMKLASRPPAPVQDEAEHVERAEVIAKLLEGRRPIPDTAYFSVSASELLMPGALVVTVQPDSSP